MQNKILQSHDPIRMRWKNMDVPAPKSSSSLQKRKLGKKPISPIIAEKLDLNLFSMEYD